MITKESIALQLIGCICGVAALAVAAALLNSEPSLLAVGYTVFLTGFVGFVCRIETKPAMAAYLGLCAVIGAATVYAPIFVFGN